MPRIDRNQAQARQAQRAESGFTLTEVLVVVIIIGMLAAIAVPLFLHQQQKAFQAAVQSDLRNAANALEDAAANHEGDYLASAIPINTVIGPDTVIVGSSPLGVVGGAGRWSGASVATASTTTLAFHSSPHISVWVEVLTRTTYCINAKHSSMSSLWSFDSVRGRSMEGGCSASSSLPSTVAPGEEIPFTATPGTGTGGGSDTVGGTGGSTSCDPKDAECLAKQEAADLGCKVDDESCLKEARQKAAEADAKKYGCEVGDDACIAKAKEQEAAELAKKYGCEVGDTACISKAQDAEAAKLAGG